MASQDQDHQLHFVLVPLMAPGHMIPMIDMAKLFAERGVMVSIVTTPINASRFKNIIDRAIVSGFPIQFLQLRFPGMEAGVPEGCENLDSIPSPELVKNFFVATSMLQEPLEQLLQEQRPLPSCIISDMGHVWTSEIARKLQIPRVVFHGTCCFSLLCYYNIVRYKVRDSVASDSEPFVVPGLPDRIEMTKRQISGTMVAPSFFQDVGNKIRQVEGTEYGVVVNSFFELEQQYVEGYQKAKGNSAWCIGPVSLCNKETLDKADRGNKASIDEAQCLEWLNSWTPNSVIYACLGSLCRLLPSQLIELGLGLEASNHPFIWVIKGGEHSSELEKWLADGFEERTRGKGLIIRDWAPQVLILSHGAIGGFVTHCGWNSILEAVSAGVPMVTWPLFAEQFSNEKLVVEVLRIGVKVGVEIPVRWGEEEEVGVLVKREDLKKAIDQLLDEGEEGQERRKKAKEFGDAAKTAVEEGGSSHLNISLFIQDIMQQTRQKVT